MMIDEFHDDIYIYTHVCACKAFIFKDNRDEPKDYINHEK